MMSLLSLYPEAGTHRVLKKLYLSLNLHRQAAEGDVQIYANYIASVDGRISLFNEHSDEFEVPLAIANKRDWRLYQELAAQADVMITSARYFRQLDVGKAQDLLPVGQEPEYVDLAIWRKEHGLKAQPDVVIISNSLDIPLSALDKLQDRRISILSGCNAEPNNVKKLRQAGFSVTLFASDKVSGKLVKQWLVESAYRSAYMIAGPEVHQTLIADRVLDRLFLTTHLTLLGENSFHTVLSGSLNAPVKLRLESMYLDQSVEDGQIFTQYALQRA